MTAMAAQPITIDWRIDKKKLLIALALSVAVHAMLFFLVRFTDSPAPIVEKKAPHIMDVALLDESTSTSKKEDDNAKIIANKNSAGNQTNAQDDVNRAARAPAANQAQPNQNKPAPLAPQMPRNPPVPQQQEKVNNRIISRKDDDSTALLPTDNDFKEDKKPTSKPAPNIPLANLLPSSSALTQLSREFDRERRMKQFLSKEAEIGINTRESKYAPYISTTVQAIESTWRLPNDVVLDELPINGNTVLMRLSIGLSGELLDIKILRPSPSPELNDSAVQAVYKAAPYTRLPSSWGLERANIYIIFEVVADGATFRTFR